MGTLEREGRSGALGATRRRLGAPSESFEAQGRSWSAGERLGRPGGARRRPGVPGERPGAAGGARERPGSAWERLGEAPGALRGGVHPFWAHDPIKV